MSRLLKVCVLWMAVASSLAHAAEAPIAMAAPAGVALSAAEVQAQAAARVAAPFVMLAGSQANAVALATALKTGTPATLTPVPSGATTTASLVPPTKPMGWANVSHSLELAQFALTDAGIAHPTTAELIAALVGGVVVTPGARTVALPGVLKQRAAGMAWSEIAHRYGTTMRAFNRTSGAPRPTVTAAADRGH